MRTLLVVIALLLLAVMWLVLVGGTIDDTPVKPASVRTSAVFDPPPPLPTTSSTSSTSTTVRVAPVARTAPIAPSKRSLNVWDSVAACESGGRWDDTRGGYEGGVHFMHQTWVAAGGRRFAEHAYQASRDEQITIAKSWLARTSVKQWPVCGPKAHLTMADAA